MFGDDRNELGEVSFVAIFEGDDRSIKDKGVVGQLLLKFFVYFGDFGFEVLFDVFEARSERAEENVGEFFSAVVGDAWSE